LAPEPVRTLWRRETSCSCQESNPGLPARSPSRRHGHRNDKNGVYSTFIFHLISVFNCFNYACLLLTTSPFCNSDCINRTMFPRQRILRTDTKEDTCPLLRAATWQRTQKKTPPDRLTYIQTNKLSILYTVYYSLLIIRQRPLFSTAFPVYYFISYDYSSFQKRC
jgi:hypothetical protein